jgi:DNA-binding transcriptional LysR family regulator
MNSRAAFDWNDLRHLLTVAREGSTAAKALGLSQPTVQPRPGVRLTVAPHRVYGSYRPRVPWIEAATLSAFCAIAM